MRFVDDKNNEARFDESFNVIKEKDSPVRNIGNANQPTNFSYYPETVIKSEELFQLKVNTKGVGTFLFAFKFEKLNREKLIDKIYALKKDEVTDKESALVKVEKLKKVCDEHNPIFVVYSNPDTYALSIEEARRIFGNLKFFYVVSDDDAIEEAKPAPMEVPSKEVIEEHEEEIVEIVEEHTEEEVNEEPVVQEKNDTREEKKEEPVAEKPAKEDKEPFSKKIKSFFSKIGLFFKRSGHIIKYDKINFLFTLIAAVLIGFTVGVGLYKAYYGQYICIFFFVVAIAGMVLNAFVYRDALIDNRIKSLHFLLNVITSIIGVGMAIGFYFIFVYFTKEKANPAPSIILFIAIQLICLVVSFGGALLLKKFRRKKK